MPNTVLPAAVDAAQCALNEAVKIDNFLPPFTGSIEVAEWAPSDGSMDALVARADAAPYGAKGKVLNRVEIVVPSFQVPA